MLTETEKKLIIDAEPTKDFFINMLTKDIKLGEAIIDLVDNCVDGALRIRPERNFEDLWIRVEVKHNHFRIIDNCGGIPVNIARNYAFRFGRPEEMPLTSHSIGHIGVGMKRAFFKLGSTFKIKSRSENSSFNVEVDVNKWKSQKDWTFIFDDVEEELPDIPLGEKGTTITVNTLHGNVMDLFKSNIFKNGLREAIRKAHQQSITDGISISLNGIPVEVEPHKLLHSEDLKPAYDDIKLPQNGVSINVKIYAGITDSKPEEAGWYIYCNGRMIMGADQTITTGWGEGGGKTIPKYHNQFARFRGFIFFDSDDASLLPWNTTKTGVDADSKIYRGFRQKMYTMMRPVITFLNRLDAEKGVEDTDHKPLENAVSHARKATLTNLKTSSTFIAPKPKPKVPVIRTGRISYNRPSKLIDIVKKALNVRTLKKVGEGTFDYFFERECEE